MKRFVIVGAGFRCYHMFAKTIRDRFSDRCKLVGVCDPNYKRAQIYIDTIDKDMKYYEDFDKMLAELKPDAVLVTTPDGLHHKYIIKALEAGIDVYTEKPLTTTKENCEAIREAERKSGKKVTITFNCRFVPYFAKLKEVVNSGIIGTPLSINYDYHLPYTHGGDYFKRWHRHMEKSGGMLVHKSTHHFDVMNWILGDDPESVIAQANRVYYGNDDRPHGERCLQCKYKETCTSFDWYEDDKADIQLLYFGPEDVDNYHRDHCVFKPDTDIYDNMSVSVKYTRGAILTYTLHMFSPSEGFRINITGTKGRIEFNSFDYDKSPDNVIVAFTDDKCIHKIIVPKASGMHGGGDDRMLDMFFGDRPDPLGQCSTSYDGIKSAMIGISANQSIKEGKRIELTEFLKKMK
jgi:predicted dehydrogenase